jgi:hypothetical protein
MKTNIGLIGERAATLEPHVLRKLQVIIDCDFEPVKARLLVDFPNYTAEQLTEMELEVKRFLALALFEPKCGFRIAVSEKIDALWHYFILHTREYRRFCAEVFGSYLHHEPILPSQKAELGPDYDRTRKLYATYFGPPPIHLWGETDQICWGGCSESPVEDRAAMPAFSGRFTEEHPMVPV